MHKKNHELLASVIRRVIRPLAKLLLEQGFSYGAFAEAAKRAFIDSAQHDFALPGKKQTISRISTITGMTRKEVHRILTQSTDDGSDNERRLNRTARVISGWISDKRFCDKTHPKTLPFDGRNSFSELVRIYSGDITPRTIADEMTRLGAIELTNKGEIKLLKHAYIVDHSDDEQLIIFGTDIAEMINTIHHNLNSDNELDRFFQRKVYYDNIPQDAIPHLKPFINQSAQKCLEEINEELAKYDLDNNPRPSQSIRTKIGLGIHYIEEVIEE